MKEAVDGEGAAGQREPHTGVDAHTFREVMRRWASGVTVVTCRDPERDGGVHGMTASSFTSVSLDPPLVLICIHRRAHSHTFILQQQAFGIHILSGERERLSDRCAGFLGEEGHRLDDLPHRTEKTGAPILEGALAWMDCLLRQVIDGGDHSIFVGEIVAAGHAIGTPLLWFNRGYHRLDDLDLSPLDE